MKHETMIPCGKCGIVPVYQTARATEQRHDLPGIVYRLQCPICGRHGAYCTTKQVATEYWNRESFEPQRGDKK